MKIKALSLYGLLFGVAVYCDRITKLIALRLYDEAVTITSWLDFTLVWNSGISWGMLQKLPTVYTWVLTVFIIAIMLAFLGFTVKQYQRGKVVIGEVIVLAGASSNVVDRFLYGAVIDFIHVTWPVSFPVFNIADMLIVVGVGIVVFNQVQEV